MDTESLLISLGLVAVLVIAYRRLRRRAESGDSSPERFFGGQDEETLLAEPDRGSTRPSDRR